MYENGASFKGVYFEFLFMVDIYLLKQLQYNNYNL